MAEGHKEGRLQTTFRKTIPGIVTHPSGDGALFLVADLRDVASLVKCGVPAALWPSISDGLVESASASLRAIPVDRGVIVVGVNDADPVRGWPGRDLAMRIAKSLANDLGRPVGWAMPPTGLIGGIQEWVDDLASGFAESEDWSGVGRDIKAHLIDDVAFFLPRSSESSDEKKSQFKFIDSKEFMAGDYRPRWLVPKILVRGQPGLIAGPSKGMKTSLLVDLAASIATATPFLGKFPVRERARVAVVSGESGEHTLQETCRRILAAKHLDDDALDGWLKWEFTLPTLTDESIMTDFGQQLARVEADATIIDPTYMCLGGVDAKNMFEMGEALKTVGKVLRKHRPDLTVVLVHHANRQLPIGEPMELQHLAYSGLEQFARQWILLNRREPYANDGTHKIWTRVGGSVGIGGLWGVDINEGLVDEDFCGRKWDVDVLTPDEVKSGAVTSRDSTKRERLREEMNNEDRVVLDVIDAEQARGLGGATLAKIRAVTGFGDTKAKKVVERLLGNDLIEKTEFDKPRGKGASVREKGYRRAAD